MIVKTVLQKHCSVDWFLENLSVSAIYYQNFQKEDKFSFEKCLMLLINHQTMKNINSEVEP